MKAPTTMLVLLLFLSGCSNDSVFEGISDNSGRKSVIEEAAIALDDEDYASVIQMLTEIYTTTSPDPQVSRLLSSAYMGRAGVVFVNLIEYSGLNDQADFDMVSESLSLSPAPIPDDNDNKNDQSLCNAEDRTVLIFPNEADPDNAEFLNAQFIDGHCIGDLIDNLEKAQYVLRVLKDADRHALDDEIQLGLASATHFVYFTGTRVADGLNKTLAYQDPERHVPGLVPVPINIEAYRFYREERFSFDQVTLSMLREEAFREENLGIPPLNTYQRDLIDVYDAVLAFDKATPEQNDVRDALQDFLASVLGIEGATISEFDKNDIISTMTTSGVYNLVISLSAE
ncbi:MAG: hypothetical protein QM299_10895 [Pseudomonadota bacterium]|nr:hypothetical protein [Pseudomonadota bacterium]